jgi:ketosteroid isomerase-like protein
MRAAQCVALIPALLAACLVTPQGNPGAVRAAIDSANARWMAGVASGNADSVAAIYATNARLMEPNAPTTVGRAAIRAAWAQGLGLGKWSITLTTDSVWANGALVFESGTWASTFTGAAPIPPTDKGKYIQRWIQEDGHWVVADDIYSSDNPPPAPPPAPAPARPTSRRRR